MLKRLVNALRGSVRLEVTGAFPERLLNLCAQKGIQFWNVEWLEPTRLRLTVTRQAVSNWENGKNQPDLEMLALLSWALEADVSALLGGDAPPRSRGNLRRAVWFALALLGAALACRLPLPYLAEWYQRTYIMWPYQLYLLLLRPLLWALGGWTLIAALHAFPGIPPLAGRPRRVLFWCGLAWCLVWLSLPLLGFVLSSLPVYLSLVWILRAPWIHLPGAIAMALGALKGRQ